MPRFYCDPVQCEQGRKCVEARIALIHDFMIRVITHVLLAPATCAQQVEARLFGTCNTFKTLRNDTHKIGDNLILTTRLVTHQKQLIGAAPLDLGDSREGMLSSGISLFQTLQLHETRLHLIRNSYHS